MLPEHMWSKEALQSHSLDMRQFVGFRESRLPNGMRLIEGYNTAGLNFTLLPDRGLDIWTASYKGIPLTWMSPGAPFPADGGAKWLQLFNGGLLTTCGLMHVGPPETNDITDEYNDLHGRYTRLSAPSVAQSGEWVSEAEYKVTLSASLHEVQLHGEQLELQRTYTMSHNKPVIHIEDTVINHGDRAEPLMFLYHVNIGYPMIAENATLLTPHKAVYSRESQKKVDDASWPHYTKAVPGFTEEVYFHHIKSASNEQKRTGILLHHNDIGLSLDWNVDELPYFTQWKNTRQGQYVSGLEPGNCIPEGQNAARKNGRLQMLEPGQAQKFTLNIEVLEAEEIQQAKTMVETLQNDGVAAPKFKLDDYDR